MSDVTPDEIRRIARLAALQVDDQSLPLLTQEIARIIEYVSQLRLADVDTGEASYMWLAADLPLPPRRDTVRTDRQAPDPVQFAPAYKGGLFVVPRLSAMEDV